MLIAKIAKCRLCTAFFSSNFYFLLLCDMYQQKCPNEYKLEFDVATHKFDASYRYDDYTKSGISPVSELMSWYGEIKESM